MEVQTARMTPVIMQLSSVLGIIEGRKCHTSRVMKEQPPADATDVFYWWHADVPKEQCADSGCYYWCPSGLRFIPCPYGEPGDFLYVKESWRPVSWNDGGWGEIEYADGSVRSVDGEGWGFNRMFPARRKDSDAWRSPMFMPKFASRLTLKIEEITCRRIQDISEEDAQAEGVGRLFSSSECASVVGIVGTHPGDHGYKNYLWHGLVGSEITRRQADSWLHQFSNYETAAGSFASLWERINGPRGHGWAKNEYVWGIRFSVAALKYKSSDSQP